MKCDYNSEIASESYQELYRDYVERKNVMESFKILDGMLKEELSEIMVTAGELRDKGFIVPKHIPDCAETQHQGLKFKEVVNISTEEDTKNNMVRLQANFDTSEFNWVTIDLYIDKNGNLTPNAKNSP